MGIYTDLLINAVAWNSGTNGNGVSAMIPTDAAITDEIKTFKVEQSDPVADLAFTEANEVQTISQYAAPASSGNITITVNLNGEDAFTTANVAWDANAAAVEGAIDTAATTAAVTDWVNGDINVALTTNLNGGDATLTFNGTSVMFKNHGQTTTANVNLDTTPGATDTTTPGQANRYAWAAMDAMGLVTGGPPPTGEVTGLTATTTRLANLSYPSHATLQALAMQAAIEDGNDDIFLDLMDLFKQRHAV